MCDPACIEFGIKYLKKEEVENKKVIEIGSYNINGSLRTDVLKLKPLSYLGVDILKGPCVDEVCDITDITNKYGKESFDVAISTEVLEHVKDWKLAISNMKNVIKPGGVVIITTRSIGFSKHDHPFDFWRFEVSDMNHIFSDFIIEKIETDPYGPGVFIKAKKPLNFIEKDLKDFEVYSMV